MDGVPITLAFIAGIVSFLSPCIFPIVPGFLAYLAGSSTNATGATRRETFINAVFFVLGFAVVFAMLGILLQTTLASIAYDARIWLSRIGGVIIIVFGLYLTKLIRIPLLDHDYSFHVAQVPGRSRYLTSSMFGAAFAAGWTPCVGAVLGAILTLAVTNPGSAFAMLMVYGLGLGVPFLVVGLFAAGAQTYINRFAKTARYLSVTFGVLLVVIGGLVFTQRLERIANFEFLNRIILRY